MKTSSLESRFMELWKRRHLMGGPPWVAETPDPEREYRFHPDRMWRFDFCWPAYRLAVEMEGGVFTKDTRHVDGAGYANDCEKYNAALELGWRVFRFTARDVANATSGKRAIQQVCNVLRLGRAEGCSEQLQLFT